MANFLRNRFCLSAYPRRTIRHTQKAATRPPLTSSLLSPSQSLPFSTLPFFTLPPPFLPIPQRSPPQPLHLWPHFRHDPSRS